MSFYWIYWNLLHRNGGKIQYIPINMHTVFALLCFVVVIHWLIFPYPSGLLHWHCGNLMIAPVPAKQPWWIWINTSCKFIMNDCITTTKQSTTKPCAYFLGHTVQRSESTTSHYRDWSTVVIHINHQIKTKVKRTNVILHRNLPLLHSRAFSRHWMIFFS